MNEAFDSIRRGLRQAIAHQSGKGRAVKVPRPRPVDVRKVRGQTGLTQSDFAATFGIGLGTLRHWERGDRTPRGATLVLLNVIASDPAAVLKALHVKGLVAKKTVASGTSSQAATRSGKRGGKGAKNWKEAESSL